MRNSNSLKALLSAATRTRILPEELTARRNLAYKAPIKRHLSSSSASPPSTSEPKPKPVAQTPETPKTTDTTAESQSAESKDKFMTMAEKDEELRLKLEGRSGEGGAAGLELENGKPVAMKRGVRDNMFRLI